MKWLLCLPLLLPTAATAQEGFGIILMSHHFKPTYMNKRKHNEENPGVYYENSGWRFGTYTNSHDKDSWFVSKHIYYNLPAGFQVGAFFGFATGYPKSPWEAAGELLPVGGVQLNIPIYQRVQAEISLNPAVVGLSLRATFP